MEIRRDPFNPAANRQAIALLALLLAAVPSSPAQQPQADNPRVTGSASCKFSDGNIVSTAYRVPDPKGRKSPGGVVPYGKVWPASAGQAPTLVTDVDLNVGGEDVPAGSYTLFAIPGIDKWTLIVSKSAAGAGSVYSEDKDLRRIDMKISKTPELMENFTIVYNPGQAKGNCTLKMSWEHTLAYVDVAEKKLCWPTSTPLTYQCPDQ